MGTCLVYAGIENTQQQEVNPCPLRILYAITGAGFKGNCFPRFRTQLVALLKKYQGFVMVLEIAPGKLPFGKRNGRPLCDLNLAEPLSTNSQLNDNVS